MIRVLVLTYVDGKPQVQQLVGEAARAAVATPLVEPGTLCWVDVSHPDAA